MDLKKIHGLLSFLRLGTLFEVMYANKYKEIHDKLFKLSDLIRKTLAEGNIRYISIQHNKQMPLS